MDLFGPDLKGPENVCLVAVGGYGRQELFPCSDVDLLFVSTTQRTIDLMREPIAALVRQLWDLRMRVGHSARTLAECGQLQPDNLEFNVSLLDVRYLAGSTQLFEELRSRTIPHMVARDQHDLVRNLIDVTLRRHEKHGNTIFQLEPNIKEAPGGLRDYHVGRWLALIEEMANSRSQPWTRDLEPPRVEEELGRSWRFLSAVRCFLHYQRGRDDNLLTYDVQDEAARLGLGVGAKETSAPGTWMRNYFIHARLLYRRANRLIEDAQYPRSSLYGVFLDWRSRLSNSNFSVIRGRIFPRSTAPGPEGLASVLGLFEMVARHGLELSREAETWVEDFLANVQFGASDSLEHWAAQLPAPIWPPFRSILALPRSAAALRAMHALGLLTALFPELKAIDALVIHDFYHRYTVDEHSFMAIQSLCELRRGKRHVTGDHADGPLGEWIQRFASLYSEIEQPELLSLALLFHDVGKGMEPSDHVEGSLQAARAVCTHLSLDAPGTEIVLFLIARHLDMSATIMRRDIFDPDTVRSFADRVGESEKLKMLCLFTYADVRAVNPEALTPWKAEMLWQLYTMAFNHLSHSLDEDRFSAAGPAVDKIARVASQTASIAGSNELNVFLDGFPKRYLETHSPEEISEHFTLAQQLPNTPVEVRIRRRANDSELTIITADRPYLLATITGVLAGWGMNILKADAFANRAGIALDVLRFHDVHRTLDLNASERTRFEDSLSGVLTGQVALQQVMAGRVRRRVPSDVKVKVPAQITFEESASRRCTLLELIAQDHPGLLYQVSSTLAGLGCNIEVALIDTEAQRAIDVFYLTAGGQKLSRKQQDAIRSALLVHLSDESF
jgi:[protein-PII] uridylyltransferase